MMPRLTIGIPTRNRPEMFRRAVDSALAQTIPVRIVVNDSGACVRTSRLCEDLAFHSPVDGHDFVYIKRDGGTLWENWKHVARQATTEFFAWLQDDDVIVPRLAERIVNAFDRYPQAKVYCSRLTFSADGRLGCSFYGSWGPRLCLDFIQMRPSEFPGELLVPIGYCDVWGQAPAKAFRVGDPFHLMLDSLPGSCDKFTERLDIAFMGLHGTAIADPNVAGLSVIHDSNESELTSREDRKQAVIAYKFLDILAMAMPDWRAPLFEWLDTPGVHCILQLLYNQTSAYAELSQNCKDIRSMLGGVMRAKCGMPI